MRVSPVYERCHAEPLMETRPQLGNLSETMGPWEGEAVAQVGVGGEVSRGPQGEVGQGSLTPQKGLWVPLSIPKLSGRPWLFWVSHSSRMQQLCRTMQPGWAQARLPQAGSVARGMCPTQRRTGGHPSQAGNTSHYWETGWFSWWLAPPRAETGFCTGPSITFSSAGGCMLPPACQGFRLLSCPIDASCWPQTP